MYRPKTKRVRVFDLREPAPAPQGPTLRGPRLLDLDKSNLLPFEVHEGTRRHLHTLELHSYGQSAALRKVTLKARSVLAAAFKLGDFTGRVHHLRKGDVEVPYLFLGQSEVLENALLDFSALVGQTSYPIEPQTKMLLPLSAGDGGWRTQHGWVVIRYPAADDDLLFAEYLRPGLAWLQENTSSFEAIQAARRFNPGPLKPMASIFAEALKPQPVLS